MQTSASTTHKMGKPDNTVQTEKIGILLTDETIAVISEQLPAQGLRRETIVMPGCRTGATLFIAADFDAPIPDFAD
jgi:hypothetical protein